MEAKFKNGDIVKDTVTEYQGMIVATTAWLNGCYRYTVQAQALTKDGAPVTAEAFDENQLVVVKDKKHVAKDDTGGPRPSVTRESRRI